MPDYAAARELGDLLARVDGYLPGPAAAAAMRIAEAAFAERAVSDSLASLASILAMCEERGHASQDSEFECNDMDNHAFTPPSGRDGLALLALRDQNRQVVLAVSRNAAGAPASVAVHVHGDSLETWFDRHFAEDGISEETLDYAAWTEDFANPHAPRPLADYAAALAEARAGAGPSLLARFRVDGTRVSASVPPPPGFDGIATFNSAISGIETVACCLSEEPAAPRPA
jgi:hypothetical protein